MTDAAMTMIDAGDRSSNVAEYGYHPESQTLAVRFHNGGLYHYSGVPPEKFDAMHRAESLGKFLHSEVKGKHEHIKQTEQP
jgi:hypothetical protein